MGFCKKKTHIISRFSFFMFFVFRTESPLGIYFLRAESARCNLYFGFRSDFQNPRLFVFRFSYFSTKTEH